MADPSASLARMRAVLKHQLRSILRDKRTVTVAFVVPLAIVPLMLFVSSWISSLHQERRASAEIVYAIAGPDSEYARQLMADAAEWKAETDSLHPLRIREASTDSALSALAGGDVDLVLRSVRFAKTSGGSDAAEKTPLIRIYYRGSDEESDWMAESVSQTLRDYRDQARSQLLRRRGVIAQPDSFMSVTPVDVAPEGRTAASTIGRFTALFVLFFVLSGGAVVAMDLVAGERERGSLETLLTSAITRRELAASKQLIVLAVALAITLLQSLNLLLYTSLGLLDSPLAQAQVPVATVLAVLLLLLPLAFLASGVLLLISSRARTYKESQILLFPVILLGAVPAAAPLIPGISLQSVAVIIPVANVALAIRDVLTGNAVFGWIAASWIVTAGAGVLASIWSARLLASSVTPDTEMLPNSPLQLRLRLFNRAAPRAFMLMFALILISSSLFASRLGVQVLANMFLILLGGSLLLLRRFHLPMARTLRLFKPSPMVWPFIAAAVPAGIVLSSHVYRLSASLFPTSARMLEEMFARGVAPEAPVWQLLLLGALLPGICEEVAFRGVLLGSVRRSLGATAAIVLSAVVFGLFHMTPVRFLPTAFLGLLLGLSVLLTGSILPAIAWHTLNNAFALLASGTSWDPSRPGTALTVASALVITASFYAMARSKRPEPMQVPLDKRPDGSG